MSNSPIWQWELDVGAQWLSYGRWNIRSRAIDTLHGTRNNPGLPAYSRGTTGLQTIYKVCCKGFIEVRWLQTTSTSSSAGRGYLVCIGAQASIPMVILRKR